MQVLQMFYKEKDLVVSATRNAKPISQVAENITVITAQEIENMNAHTVADVLNRIPGLFINFNQDFGATSLLLSQGSEERHVLVVVDGIRWNFLSDGHAETNTIPVGIIERIEVIKGPASSSWGSSLGGVVNIITKDAGKTTRPSGSLSASYGERDTQDYRAQVAGLAGPMGYYLYAGHQESDGLRDGREFVEDYNLYSKFHLPVSSKVNTDFTLGYSEPEVKIGDFPSGDITQKGASRTFFATASLDASLTKELSFAMSFHEFKQRLSLTSDSLGLFGLPWDPPGSLMQDSIYDEENTGGDAKFTWTHGMHTAVFGGEFDRGTLDQTLKAGNLLQLIYGLPAMATTSPGINRWALYANDTIVIDRWSITPGIRYDRNNITGSFVSPSLGVTYRIWRDSILRASVARGFTIPPLSMLSGGTLFAKPNSSLNPEKIMSYQFGGETAALKYFWLKATFFRHEIKDTLTAQYEPFPSPYFTLVNGKKVRRQGGEMELQTVSFYNFYFVGGFSYVHFSPPTEASGTKNSYSYSLGFRYDDNKSIRAELFGHYVWWNLDSRSMAKYDNFLWDLNLAKKIFVQEKTTPELFFTAHNLFNGANYTRPEFKNPQRWVEAGIRIKFK